MVAVLLGATVLAAGCADEGPGPTAAPAGSGLVIDADRPDTRFTEVRPAGRAGPDLEATVDAPPVLVAGEWWKIEFGSPLTGETYPMVLVVANASEDGYLFGLPHEGWAKEAVAYHSPGLGDVGRDLSYNIHNQRFEPLRFPLTEGAEWTTSWIATEYVARVTAADQYVAEIGLFHPPDDGAMTVLMGGEDMAMVTLTYDAREHGITSFASSISSWRVIEHGYGYEGWVTIPRGQETVIDDGKLGPVRAEGSDGAGWTRTIAVDGGYNRLTIMHVVAALGPGQFRLASQPPAGSPFVTEVTGGPDQVVQIFEASDPDGTWTQEEWAAGIGQLYTMAIGYHQYDIRLPDQARRADHSHAVIR